MTDERRKMEINIKWYHASSSGTMAIYVEIFMRNSNQAKILYLFRWLHDFEEYGMIEDLYNWIAEYIEYRKDTKTYLKTENERIIKRLSNVKLWLEKRCYV